MRVIFALTFWVVLWLDPQQPVRLPQTGYWLLAGYVAYAVVAAVIAWRSWWWDARLGLAMWLLDLTVFYVALVFTEDRSSNFTSPYIAFFTFLVMAALLRWGWRRTAVLVPALALLYLAEGILMEELAWGVDLQRFVRRTIFMVLLPVMFIWFAASRGGPRLSGVTYAALPMTAPIASVVEAAAAYAAAELGASSVAIAWLDPEEPWSEIVEWRDGSIETRRLAPSPDNILVMLPVSHGPVLFATDKRRSLYLTSEDRVILKRGPVECPLAALCGATEGISFPIRSSNLEGRMILWGILGLCSDDMGTAELLRTEIESHVDRQSIAVMQDRAAVSHLREAIARDLHDGVAQSLAGAAFRLERLRATLEDGGDLEAELVEAKSALRMEQQNVRGLIATLKTNPSATEQVELANQIHEWLPAIAAGWGVAVELDAAKEPILVSARSAHEVRQLLREAVANAVRHGAAGRVRIRLAHMSGKVELVIEDDGRGFPTHESVLPWSIMERVQTLGGSLDVNSTPAGARLHVVVPAGASA